MSRRIFTGVFMWACAFSLAACSPTSMPQRIAASPRSQSVLHPAPLPQEIVYNLFLAIEAANPEWAAGQASRLAYRHGGYQVNVQTWERGGIRYASQVLCVPSYRFDAFRNDLAQLGKMIDEHTSGALADPYDGGQAYSQVVVQFQSPILYLSEPVIQGWKPMTTIRKAFSVFLTLFGFLADILIWLLVVIGPFFLLGWGVWKLARRKSSPRE